VKGASRRETAWGIAVVLAVIFAIAAHVAIVEGFHQPLFGAWLSLVPLAGLLASAVRRWRRPRAMLVAAITAVAAVWLGWPLIEHHFASMFFAEHAGANLVLAIVFGHTLLGNREALCTRFARLLHGTLPAEVERYTRQVTAAWTIFFAVMFVLSCALYLGGDLAAWSLFANIASPVLVAAMFVVEYLVRYRVLPNWERTGVLGGIRAFARHFATAQLEAPR